MRKPQCGGTSAWVALKLSIVWPDCFRWAIKAGLLCGGLNRQMAGTGRRIAAPITKEAFDNPIFQTVESDYGQAPSGLQYLLGRIEARFQVAQNGGGVFGAGVVAGQDQLIAEAGAHPGHFGPFGFVAVAAGARHDDHF